MPKNILITGTPKIGKTTLIKRLLRDLAPLVVHGFYKEAIIESDICRGFRIVTPNLNDQVLAHVHIEGPDRNKEFGVNIEGFERLVLPEMDLSKLVDIFVLDEIGKMECMSQKFCAQLKKILDSKIPMIATVALSQVPGIRNLKKRKDVKIIQMTQRNRDSLWKDVLLNID